MNAVEAWSLDGRAMLGLVNLALAATLAAALGLAVNRACRRRSAALRYGLLVAALMLAMLSPALVCLAGRASLGAICLPIAAPPDPASRESQPASAAVPLAAGAGAHGPSFEAAAYEDDLSDPVGARGIPSAESTATASRDGRADAQPAAAAAAGSLWQLAGTLLCGAWAAGTAAALALLLRGLMLAGRLRRALLPSGDPRLREAAESAAGTLGLRRVPPVLISRLSPIPLSVGLARPVIAMPEGLAGELSDAELQAVVLHESAHILHRDHWVGLAQRVLGAAFWWNPLVHLLNHRISETREEVCDERVLGLIGQGRLFARCLLKVAAHLQGVRLLPAAVGLVQNPQKALESRVRRLLETPGSGGGRLRGRLATAVACFALTATAAILVANVRTAVAPSAADTSVLPAGTRPDPHGADLAPAGAPLARTYRRSVSLPGMTYVVDGSAGNDKADGSEQRPFKTLARGVKALAPGDTLMVREGVYEEAVKIDLAGTEAAPILIQAAAGQRVVIKAVGSQPAMALAPGTSHLMIDGFEIQAVEGASSHAGIATTEGGAHHVEITHCVFIGTGINLRTVSDSLVRRCVQTGCPGVGISLAGCKDVTIEENDISGNGGSAMSISKGSDGVRLVRNCVHNGRTGAKSVGVSVREGVTNLLMQGNLLLGCTTALDVRDAEGGRLVNNMIAGTFQTGISLGYRSTRDYELVNNTVAYTGYRTIVFDGRNTCLRNNVFTAGGDGKLFVAPEGVVWESDYNLFWKYPGGQHSEAPGQDAHSRDADPHFRSAPPLRDRGVYYVHIFGQSRVAECTPGRLYLAQTPVREHFAVGDRIEVDYDGVGRTVTEATDECLSFDPPLEKVHPKGWHAVVNWKDRDERNWDLRLADGSPGKGMGDDGRDVGSSIDMQAYLNGDFDGDGRRDLPPMAKAAAYPG